MKQTRGGGWWEEGLGRERHERHHYARLEGALRWCWVLGVRGGHFGVSCVRLNWLVRGVYCLS